MPDQYHMDHVLQTSFSDLILEKQQTVVLPVCQNRFWHSCWVATKIQKKVKFGNKNLKVTIVLGRCRPQSSGPLFVKRHYDRHIYSLENIIDRPSTYGGGESVMLIHFKDVLFLCVEYLISVNIYDECILSVPNLPVFSKPTWNGQFLICTFVWFSL